MSRLPILSAAARSAVACAFILLATAPAVVATSDALDVPASVGPLDEEWCALYITPDGQYVCLLWAAYCVDVQDPCAYVCPLPDLGAPVPCYGLGAPRSYALPAPDVDPATPGAPPPAKEEWCPIYATPDNEFWCPVWVHYCPSAADPCLALCFKDDRAIRHDPECAHHQGGAGSPIGAAGLASSSPLDGAVAIPDDWCVLYITPNNEVRCLLRVVQCQRPGPCVYVCVAEDYVAKPCWGSPPPGPTPGGRADPAVPVLPVRIEGGHAE